MSDPEIAIAPDLPALQAAAAARMAEALAAAQAAHGRALLAISGGSAPPGMFRLLCEEPLRGQISWADLSLIFVDERFVPFSSPDSNYAMARQALLDYVPLPSDQVYPVPTYYASPAEAAGVYARQVTALLELHDGRIDLALLGMGPDGHTASLFPGHAALGAPADALVLAVEGAPKPPPQRITLSAAVLNRAAVALFLVAGADKAPAVRAALRGPHDPQHHPTQLIRPPAGRVLWMLDAAAAAEL